MNPLGIEIKMTGNLPVNGKCRKCRDSSLCYETPGLSCEIMSDDTWEKIVEFMERINFSGEVVLLGHIEKDRSFLKRWDLIKKFCSKINPAWIHINWKYITDDIINICGDNLRLNIRFGPYSFDNFNIEDDLIQRLCILNSRKIKYLLTVAIVENEMSIDEVMPRFNQTRDKLSEKLGKAGFDNAKILWKSLCFEMCLSDETIKAFNKMASLQCCKDVIPLLKVYGYTDPVYDNISTEVCSTPMLLCYINWNGDISRCCLDYNCRKTEGNIHHIHPEDLFKGLEYCNYPVKCYDENPL